MHGPLPRLPVWIVTRSVRPDLAADIVGDLEERWRASEGPRARASVALVRIAVAVAWHASRERVGGRDARGRWVAGLRQDAAFALRLLRLRPLAAGAVVLTLALSIGATTALFSVVDAWMLRPLPFATPDRLVAVWETIPEAGVPRNTPAPVVLQHWRDTVRDVEALAAMTRRTRNLTGLGDPVRLQEIRAEPGLLRVLGIVPVVGRLFTDDEGRAPAPPVVLLSDRAWQRYFDRSPSAIGALLTLDRQAHEVAGVLPPHARPFGFDADIWSPLALSPDQWQSEGRYLWVVGRLRDGVDAGTATAEVDRASKEWSDGDTGANVVPLSEQTLGETGGDVLVLFGASGFLLLVACANIASLTLVQLAARRRELAARQALGASRGRIVRQVLIESLTIAALGGAGGLLVAGWASRAIVSLAPASARLAPVDAISPPVFGFALVVTALTALLFGILPAWSAGRGSLVTTLRHGGRGASAGRRRAMAVLAATEIAVTLVLVVATGLVTRSFLELNAVDLGFDPSRIVVAELPRVADDTAPVFFTEVERRLRQAPGVEGVALSQGLPLLAVGSMGAGFPVIGRDEALSVLAFWRTANAGYFDTLGIPLRDGRAFDDSDRADSPKVAIVSETFARQAWPDQSAVGRTIGWGSPDDPMTVVGVAADVRQSRASDIFPHVYMPWTQVPTWVPAHVAVRSSLPAGATLDLLRRTVLDMDPGQPVVDARTGDAVLWESMGRRRFHLTLFGLFAGTAVVLAVLGLYGVLAYALSEQRRELGIRAALGATPSRLQRQWWRRGLALVGAGLTVGLAAASAGGSLVEGFLFRVDARDPLVFAAACALVTATAAIAVWLPARRAAIVDPVQVLRAED